MGSGDWLKSIISLNKSRKQKSKMTKSSSIPASNGFVFEAQPQKQSTNVVTDVANGKHKVVGPPAEDIAAAPIQTVFRALMARKDFCSVKGVSKLLTLTQGDFGKKQTSNTLNHLHSWSRIQAQIRIRRHCMVEDRRIRQKKFENQLKLEAKLRDLDVEWSGGSHTMDEALGRIQQREAAAVKRLNDSELATGNWGWSWTDRWIAAWPWESRVLVESTPKKVNSSASKTEIKIYLMGQPLNMKMQTLRPKHR